MAIFRSNRKIQRNEISSYVIQFENNVTDVNDDEILKNIISFHVIDKPLKINNVYFILYYNNKKYEVFPRSEKFKPCCTYTCNHAKFYVTTEFYVVFTENDNFISSVGLYKNIDNPFKKAKIA
jgi:hypothetical protein